MLALCDKNKHCEKPIFSSMWDYAIQVFFSRVVTTVTRMNTAPDSSYRRPTVDLGDLWWDKKEQENKKIGRAHV